MMVRRSKVKRPYYGVLSQFEYALRFSALGAFGISIPLFWFDNCQTR
jgi:hypothetical protein